MEGEIKIKKDWKFYTGFVFFVLSMILPLIGFLIPFLDFPLIFTAILTPFLMIGGPELMVLLAVLFFGKNTLVYYKNKIYKIFKKTPKHKPVSKFRYYFGLTVMLISIAPIYFTGYFPEIMPEEFQHRFYIILSADILFIISFFILTSVVF